MMVTRVGQNESEMAKGCQDGNEQRLSPSTTIALATKSAAHESKRTSYQYNKERTENPTRMEPTYWVSPRTTKPGLDGQVFDVLLG